jgi:hypothetical protein
MWQKLSAVALFATITLGLGHTVLRLSRSTRQQNPLVRLLETAAVGLAALSFLGVVFVLMHVPLHPLAYLALASVVPVVTLVQSLRARTSSPAISWRTKQTLHALILVAVLGALFVVFHTGVTAYPYLEDDDSWLHAEGALYVAKVHTYAVDPSLGSLSGYAKYLEPYPPAYDVLMGLMRQANDSVYWTLKFFNIVIVTLAHAFFFLFFAEYTKSSGKGLFATVVLVALPSFMSHFIWSQSLALCVFPVAMYGALRAIADRSWTVPAVLAIASMMVTQPVVSFVFGVVFVLLLASVLLDETRKAGHFTIGACPGTATGLLVGAGGLATSLLYWGAQLAKWGVQGIIDRKGDEITTSWVTEYALRQATLQDTLFPPTTTSRMDQETGWGLGVTIALLAGLIASAIAGSQKRSRSLHLLVWFLVLAYALFAPSFGLPAWGASRFWAYVAVPVALLATEGVFFVSRLGAGRPRLQTGIVVLAAVAVVATGAPAKITVQTAPWSPGTQWTYVPTDLGLTPVDLHGWMELRRRLPPNTRVYSFCGDARAIGFDMDASPWDRSEAEFRHRGASVSAQEALAFFDQLRYTHFAVDASCTGTWTEEARDRLLHGLEGSGRVSRVFQQQGFLLEQVAASSSSHAERAEQRANIGGA